MQVPRRKLIGRGDADADNDKVGRTLGAIVAHDGAYLSGCAFASDRTDPRIAEDSDAVTRVLGLKVSGDFGAGHATHCAIGHLKHRRFDAELAARRCRLKANISPADDDKTPRGFEVTANCFDVPQAAQEMHAGQLRPGNSECTRPATCCEHKFVIGEQRAVIEANTLRAALDLGHAPAQMHLDRVLGIKVRRTDEEALLFQCARQVFLRQRRPLVRPGVFVTDERNRPGEALAAQRIDGLHGGLARTDDDNSGWLHGWRG
jgi:hypothetical protein